MGSFTIATILACIAGLSTAVGALLLLIPKCRTERFLNFSLAFSGGVMLLISFVEIYPKSIALLSENMASFKMIALVSLFAGFAFFYLIHYLLPESSNMTRISVIVPLVITAHNIPEGLLTFLAGLDNPVFGLKICMAVAMHNIPEGIVVAIPVYHVTKSFGKAFLMALLSGVMEIFGALVGYFLLKDYLTPTVNGILFSIIAGIMIIVALVELLPASYNKEPKAAHIGLLFGFIFMGISLSVLF